MEPQTKAAVQGAACGLVLGMVVLTGGRLWRRQVAPAQAKQVGMPHVMRARRSDVVDSVGKLRATLVLTQDGSRSVRLADRARTARVVLAVTCLKTVNQRVQGAS